MKSRIPAVLFLLIFLTVACGSSSRSAAVPTASPQATSDLLRYCRDKGYTQSRVNRRTQLVLLSPCEIASGTVTDAYIWPKDGDYVMNLRLDPGQERFLTEGNLRKLGGALHVEIEPSEQHLSELPKKGMHIVVVGVWTFDKPNQWNEIHPVWYWQQLPPPQKTGIRS